MTTLLALTPIVSVGGSAILGWLLTLAIIAAIVYFVVWLVAKFAGPPSIPEPMRWKFPFDSRGCAVLTGKLYQSQEIPT